VNCSFAGCDGRAAWALCANGLMFFLQSRNQATKPDHFLPSLLGCSTNPYSEFRRGNGLFGSLVVRQSNSDAESEIQG
jgi:hypothetical protein